MEIAVLAGAGVVPPIEIVGKIKGAEVYGISRRAYSPMILNSALAGRSAAVSSAKTAVGNSVKSIASVSSIEMNLFRNRFSFICYSPLYDT